MSEDKLKELDRDMDTVFDAVFMLNQAVTAIVGALEPKAAAHVAKALDQALDGTDNLDHFRRMTLQDWRDTAARLAGCAATPDPK